MQTWAGKIDPAGRWESWRNREGGEEWGRKEGQKKKGRKQDVSAEMRGRRED